MEQEANLRPRALLLSCENDFVQSRIKGALPPSRARVKSKEPERSSLVMRTIFNLKKTIRTVVLLLTFKRIMVRSSGCVMEITSPGPSCPELAEGNAQAQ